MIGLEDEETERWCKQVDILLMFATSYFSSLEQCLQVRVSEISDQKWDTEIWDRVVRT